MSLEDVSYGNVLIWRQQYIIKISKNISCVLLHTLEHGDAIDFNLSPLHSIGPTTHLNPNKVHRSQISSLKGMEECKDLNLPNPHTTSSTIHKSINSTQYAWEYLGEVDTLSTTQIRAIIWKHLRAWVGIA